MPSAFWTAIVAIVLSFGTAFPAESPKAQKLRQILNAPPPDPKEHSKETLAKIYLGRARAAGALGDVERELKEIGTGIDLVGPKHPATYDFHNRAAQIQLDKGDFVRAREARESALEVATTSLRKFVQLNYP